MKSDAENGNLVRLTPESSGGMRISHDTVGKHDGAAALRSNNNHNSSFKHERPTLEDFHKLINLSPARIACFVFEDDISILQPANDILKHIVKTRAHCIEANDHFVSAHGYTSVNAVLGKPFSNFFPQSHGFMEVMRQFAQNGCYVFRYPLEIPTEGSETVYFDTTLYGVTEDSLMRKVWISQRDDTRRIKEVRELERAEEHFRSLVETDTQVLVRTRLDGSYAYMSPTVEKVTGFPIERFMEDEKFFKSLLHPDDTAIHDAIYEARRAQDKSMVEVEYRVKTSDGTYKWFLERQTPVLDEKGNVRHFDSIAINIQDHKQLREKLKHAEKLSSIGKTAAGVAHNFNNHLSAVLGQIRACMIELGPDHPTFTKLASAEQAALGCSEIASQLLAFGRKGQSEHTNFDSKQLIKNTIDLLRHLLPKSISFLSYTTEDAATVSGSYSELQQVLLNLCLNARDAIGDTGEIVLTQCRKKLEAGVHRLEYPEAPPGDYIEFEVSDNGCGIPEDKLAHIFEPFYSTKQDQDGTGLGLSTSYAVLQEHNGYVDIDSEVDQGTSIRFIIPETSQKQTTNLEKIKPDSKDLELKCDEVILIAEDEEMVLSMVRSALEINGFTVLSAMDGEEAIDLYKANKERIKLAFIDYTMPKRSGLEVVQEIRMHSPNLPIIFTSGYSNQDTEGWLAEKNEHTQFIGKPYPLPTLLSLVREAIDCGKSISATE